MTLLLSDAPALCKVPIRDLGPRECFVIEVSKLLHDLRIAANENRLRDFKNTPHLSYLVGRIHGCIYGFSMLAIYHGWHETYEGIETAACNEADFLAGPYQYPEAA